MHVQDLTEFQIIKSNKFKMNESYLQIEEAISEIVSIHKLSFK